MIKAVLKYSVLGVIATSPTFPMFYDMYKNKDKIVSDKEKGPDEYRIMITRPF